MNTPSFQFLPAQALRACQAMRAALSSNSTKRLLNHRLFSRRTEHLKSFGGFDVVKFELLYLAIPTWRDVDPAALMADARGLFWGRTASRVIEAVQGEVEKNSQRLSHLIADVADDWTN